MVTSVLAGAAGGALGATTLGYGGLFLANAGVSMLQNTTDQLIANNWDVCKVNVKDVAVEGAVGAVTGFEKGNGCKHLNSMGKRFMKKSIRAVRTKGIRNKARVIVKATKHYRKNTRKAYSQVYSIRKLLKNAGKSLGVSAVRSRLGQNFVRKAWSRVKKTIKRWRWWK